ncbi:MAG: hypothetical protein V3R86_05555 [Candidatus Hydrothermarchaeaceae archaeon]
MDTPVAGKMNCFKEGPGKTKHLSKEEVEEMTSCDKMVNWVKTDWRHNEVKESELKLVDKILSGK